MEKIIETANKKGKCTLIITFDNNCKNYTTNLVEQDGVISELLSRPKCRYINEQQYINVHEIINDGWHNHCVILESFIDLVGEIGCSYDTETAVNVIEKFASEYLDIDTEEEDWLTKMDKEFKKQADAMIIGATDYSSKGLGE